ncbi:MAG: TVP38/TMEM64 family protein [Cohaesibacteraceae bacterium]|nr:TVP38/TMEM64 family protein [Cohaesibacteraceae bacterium]
MIASPQNLNSEQSGKAGMIKRWIPLLLIAGVTIFGLFQGWHQHLSFSSLIRHRAELEAFVSNNLAVALLSYAVIYVVAVALSLPGALFLTLAGGFMFGWALGGVVTIFSATLGAMIIFLVAKSAMGEALRNKAGPFVNKLAAGFQENAFSYLLFLRLVPVFPFWLVNLAPAMFGMSLRPYMIGTFIGIIPGTFAFILAGSGLEDVIAKQETSNSGCLQGGTCDFDVSLIFTPQLIAAMVALSLVALIPVLVKKVRSVRG